jgi:hypothetical protein
MQQHFLRDYFTGRSPSCRCRYGPPLKENLYQMEGMIWKSRLVRRGQSRQHVNSCNTQHCIEESGKVASVNGGCHSSPDGGTRDPMRSSFDLTGSHSSTRRARQGNDVANADAAEGNATLRQQLEIPNWPMSPAQCHLGMKLGGSPGRV